MMKRWWHVAASMLGILAVATLVGCGSSSSSSSTKQPVKITYWHRMTGSYNKALETQINNFNHSQKKYKVVGVSQGSYDALQQKIMAGAKSHSLPVMAQAPTTNIGDYVKNGFLIPYDSFMNSGSDKLTATQKADIYPSFFAAGQYKGKTYGLPFSVSTSVLFYNRDLMNKYHLSMPKTWADFAKMKTQLQGTKVAAVALDESYDVEVGGMAYGAGSKLITNDLTANLNSSKTLAAVDQILSLRKDGLLRTAGSDGYMTTPFLNKQAVFGIGSSASIPEVVSSAPKSLHWGTAQVPTFEGKNTMPLNGNDNVIFKGASKAQQQGAWAFTKFLLSAKSTAQWAIKSGYVPVTKSGVNTSLYQNYLKKHEAYQAAVDATSTSFASTVFAGYGDYRNDLMDAVDSTLTKNVSGKDAFTKLQKQTEAILKKD